MIKLSQRGFSLAELLLAAAILAFALVGLLALFVNCIILNETNRNFTFAYTAMQAKMEEIKNTSFDNLFVTCPSPRPSGSFCNQDTFNLEGISQGKGRIEIRNESTNLKRIRIVACFMSRNRLIGEDKNLDGDLDPGEDTLVSNGRLDSPAELVTLIAK